MASNLIAAHQIAEAFPGLKTSLFAITSQPTDDYNCIAWAAGDNGNFWWPGRFWPKDVPPVESRLAFIRAFATRGYVVCDNGDLEEGFEKVCLYEKLGKPKHAARQLPDGTWSSKLGRAHDISHTLEGLAGRQYGKPSVYFRRPIGWRPEAVAA